MSLLDCAVELTVKTKLVVPVLPSANATSSIDNVAVSSLLIVPSPESSAIETSDGLLAPSIRAFERPTVNVSSDSTI